MILRQIHLLEKQLKYHDKNAAFVKEKWVGKPLHYSMTFLKNILSWTVGLKWLLYPIEKMNLKSYKIKLPTFTYLLNKETGYQDTKHVAFYVGSTTPKPAGFAIINNHFPINWLNFIPSLINFVFRTIGKILGVIIIAPYTIPANMIVKAGLSIQKSNRTSELRRAYRDVEKPLLIEDFLTKECSDTPYNKTQMEMLAKNVSEREFSQSFLLFYRGLGLDVVKDLLFTPSNKELIYKMRNAQLSFYHAKSQMQNPEIVIRDVFMEIGEMGIAPIVNVILPTASLYNGREMPPVMGRGHAIRDAKQSSDSKPIIWKSPLLMTPAQAKVFDKKVASDHTTLFSGSNTREDPIKQDVPDISLKSKKKGVFKSLKSHTTLFNRSKTIEDVIKPDGPNITVKPHKTSVCKVV